ncbi:MAG: response regulator [Ruthenibacterium sp.]
MYQVLLVDDEPIILSGIKFLIDWEKSNCAILDTARNGQEALDKIRTLSPDIVLCDINMPVLTGMQLIEIVAAERPDIVFIMLTNHGDFDFAQTSLRLRAVDYLLKSQLEAENLERSLARACKEREQRAKLARVNLVDDYMNSNREQVLKDTFLRVVQALPTDNVGDAAAILEENGVLAGYGVLQIPLDFSAIPYYETFTDAEQTRLFSWQREVVDKMAKNFFEHALVFSPDTQNTTLLVLCWGIDDARWQEILPTFFTRLTSASANVTQAKPALLATDRLAGADSLAICRTQFFGLRDYYYLSGDAQLFYSKIPETVCRPLALSGIAGQLATELRAKNTVGCTHLFEKATRHISTIPHQQSQATWLCGELYSASYDVVSSLLSVEEADGILGARTQGYREISHLATRAQVLVWLRVLQNKLLAFLEQFSAGKSDLVEKARQYVQDNVEKRIMLQDVADTVCISPGYLSALFKKQYNQNFVDYINETKMQHACRLIEEGTHRIYEISYLLGFENAYYFTKVFKRHIGMTPTDYQHKLKGTGTAHVDEH